MLETLHKDIFQTENNFQWYIESTYMPFTVHNSISISIQHKKDLTQTKTTNKKEKVNNN